MVLKKYNFKLLYLPNKPKLEADKCAFFIIIILVLLKTTNFKIHKQKEMLKIMQYCKNLSVPLLFLPLKV